MFKIARLLGVCAVLLPTSAIALTDAECAAEWTKADAKSAGFLTEAEAARYFAAMRVGNKPIAEGRITQAQFLEQCKAGLFTVAKAEPGAPLAGANSFTEIQAKDRVIAAGFTKVSALTKDDKGVWRGTASQADKQVKIAVDFKGNVVAN